MAKDKKAKSGKATAAADEGYVEYPREQSPRLQRMYRDEVVKKLQDVDPTQPGVLEVSPAQEVKSSGKAGGPFDPDSQDYQLSNTGGQPLNFSASADVNWLTVGTTSGTISPQGGALVNVKLKANASSSLPKGTHTAVITFSDTTDTTNVVDVVRTWTLRVK